MNQKTVTHSNRLMTARNSVRIAEDRALLASRAVDRALICRRDAVRRCIVALNNLNDSYDPSLDLCEAVRIAEGIRINAEATLDRALMEDIEASRAAAIAGTELAKVLYLRVSSKSSDRKGR
jgi:hypothetical protein